MLKIKKIFGLVIILVFCLCFSLKASAHVTWLNASDYNPKVYPKFGANTKVYFGYGHHYPVDDFLPLDMLAKFNLISPDGTIKELTPNPGGFLATRLNFKKQGRYIVSAAIKPGFYTMHRKEGTIHHILGPKTGLKNVILSLYYEQYTKALINVGKTNNEAYSKPVGHKLEIIPLVNPYNLKGCGGYFLPIQVLFDGKPAQFCNVYATYNGFSTDDNFAYAALADSEGKTSIRLANWGPWLIKAEVVRPPSGDEMKNKCDLMHYTATLTFEVP